MIDNLLAIIAPHYCSGCDLRGSLLCDNCKYDIISEPYQACIQCQRLVAPTQGICKDCKVPYSQAWCVADRRDQLQRLIGNYKFTNARAAYRPLAQLLDARIPDLPANTIIVPIPTVSSHIRQRGYDHMLLIARHLGRLRKMPVSTALTRNTTTKQRDASRSQRISQAKAAFSCNTALDSQATYLLIDDVVTTGATMKYATQTLLDAGAGTVWVATISRQPLD
ncbi:MAG: putative Phosphoribosyltransferase [Candidatus Saccharibacteria bacterium]|nr:putative Phosphoribosyltransferase [Candidatus Saccharibacteria bacterium]